MGLFIIYSTNTGTATARPVTGWGHCPDGEEADQTQAPNELTAPTPATLKEDQDYTYDPVAKTLTATTASEPFEDNALAIRRIATELRESEWAMLPDAPLTAAEVTEWADYRGYLRSLPTKPGWPGSNIWPTKPTTTEF